ncbi:CusA/CzcA family heavy metal efflux RND transporter [Solitalea sp. MAHUQ-68]|uniref:CusA/CzcA family heavy metal efflux RND transporter n=1 Tax=Solitalea agri TaxID=2953739 RepID=A0A9X2F369_9SPHI|nr:CusA/CzcA family heavy metal efflux RND transporter [Solitalea agri]MCO4293897.1 CusA/CzcA family heavy metal efflux RND transporter [Solitalea agri]
MLDRIIYFSIKNKLVIGLFTLALIAVGVYSLTRLPIDAVPDITNNQVQIITYAPSQSAPDIERLVTYPVEQTMATIPGIEEVRSFSRFGLSVVTVVFKDNIDVYWARQQINERLGKAKELIPDGVGAPEMAPVTTGLGEIYQYAIHPQKGYEQKFNATELRTIQDWIVKRQLLGTEGVADISSFGGNVKEYEIAINSDKLRSLNITIAQLFTALEKNNQNTGGAYIDRKPNAYFIRSEGLINNLDDIGKIVIRTNSNGIPVLIRDIADVKFGYGARYGAMTYNDKGEVVGGVIMMLKGENSSKVIKNVKSRIEQISKTLPEGLEIEPFLDRTKLVDKAINTVTKNLAEGALIVIFVLVLLLGNLRAGLVVASVIPLSMLFAITMMNFFGVSGNLMSLGAIDFGLIVDGAVIIVEAAMHHLGLGKVNRRLTQQEMDLEVYNSARKIRNSAAFGEIIILIVYLPILALVGIEGKMFKPMAQTVSFAILGAFILSLTYVPMMSALCLSKNVEHKRTVADRIMDFFHRIYDPVINWALTKRAIITITAVVLFIGSLILFSRLGAEFIPSLDEGDFAVETRVMTGSSISQTVEAAQKGAKVLLANFPEVKEVVGKVGSSEIPTDPMPVEACDMMVILKDRSEWKSATSKNELAEKMQQTLEEHLPGVEFGFQQPIQMRFNELMTGARQDVVLKIYGEDLDMLTKYGGQIGKMLNGVEGAKDIYVEKVSGLPQIVINYNRDRIAQFGLSISDINQAINTAFAGQAAGFVYEGEKRFALTVRLNEQSRQSIDDVKNLYVNTDDGHQIPLEQVADVKMIVGPSQIQRDDAKRRIIVGFNVRDRDVESIVNEVKSKVENQVKFAPGYYVTYGGAFKNLEEARIRLSIAVPVALLLILILLFFTFKSIKQSLLIFTAIPLSAIGGILALWVRDMPFSISAGVGFIALFGVSVLNGIVLIAEFNRLKKEGLTHIKEIILKGTSTRLRPVIMTAAVASLGFLPMALSGSEGAEVQRPLATVVIGGLITSTILTLVVLPILYMYVEELKIKAGKKILAGIIGLWFFLPCKSNAQQLTLDSAITIAIQRNQLIKTASLGVDQQKKLKGTAIDIPKTEISLLAGQYNGPSKQDKNITITQSLPFPTVFSANAALANEEIKSAELKKAVTVNELILKIKQTYYTIQYLLDRKQLLEQQDSLYAQFARASQLRYKTGESTLLEKSAAETQLNEIHNLLRLNDADIEVELNKFNVWLNGSGYSVIHSQAKERVYKENSETAKVAQNPNLNYFKQQVNVAGQQKRVEQNRMLPDLTVGYFNQSLIGYHDVSGQAQYFDASDRFQGFQVGVALPLWFRSKSSKIKAADIQKQIAQNEFEQAEKTLSGSYQQHYAYYQKNLKSITYYRESALPNAELISKQSQEAYRLGEISYSEYLLNMNQALSIKEAYLKSLQELNQSVITLEYLTGKN